jgi:hypothetical protein
MLVNLWNFLIEKKLSRFKDEVLSVSDILPIKSTATSKNDKLCLSRNLTVNADNHSGGSPVSGAIDRDDEMN